MGGGPHPPPGGPAPGGPPPLGYPPPGNPLVGMSSWGVKLAVVQGVILVLCWVDRLCQVHQHIGGPLHCLLYWLFSWLGGLYVG